MSDKPLGPDWWQASDGTWHPPELHPSMQGASPSTIQVSDPSPITPLPSMDPVSPVATVAPQAPVAPVAQVVPVSAEPLPEAVGPVAVTPVDPPVATVEMPGFGPVPPQPVPSLADVQAHPSWSGESDLRPSAGPMFPDMFQQAVADSHLVSAVAVNFGDGESYDVVPQAGGVNDPELVEGSPFRMPAEVGAFTGASAKKRRWHH